MPINFVKSFLPSRIAQALSVVAGCAIIFIGWHYLTVTWPAVPVFRSLEWHGRWLVVSYETVNNPCTRQGNHTIYLEGANGAIVYQPLSASLNGPNMTGAVGTTFDLWFYVPSDLPPGNWFYIYRTWYSCPPLGLVHYSRVTAPVAVNLPP